MNRVVLCLVLGCAVLAGAAGGRARSQPAAGTDTRPSWRSVLAGRVKEYGHRNWVVIADAAYPAQTRAGIETVVTSADHFQVVKAVLDELGTAKHVRPNVYTDAELWHVSDRDAPGAVECRKELKQLLGDRRPQSLPHAELIETLDKAGEKFKILVLKTEMTVPYSSVFLELDCGYWSAEAEQRLRESMKPRK